MQNKIKMGVILRPVSAWYENCQGREKFPHSATVFCTVKNALPFIMQTRGMQKSLIISKPDSFLKALRKFIEGRRRSKDFFREASSIYIFLFKAEYYYGYAPLDLSNPFTAVVIYTWDAIKRMPNTCSVVFLKNAEWCYITQRFSIDIQYIHRGTTWLRWCLSDKIICSVQINQKPYGCIKLAAKLWKKYIMTKV